MKKPPAEWNAVSTRRLEGPSLPPTPAALARDAELFEQALPAMLEHKAKKRRNELRQRAWDKRKNPRRRGKAKAIVRRRSNEKLELAELHRRPIGPNLPYWTLRNERVYVVAEDLEDLPDGGAWWRQHEGELRRRAIAAGLGDAPMAWALAVLLVWVFERNLRGGGNQGAGLQAPVDVLARKLGCARSWCYELLEKLRKKGLAKRHTRKRRYVYLARDAGLTYTDVDGKPRPLTRWRDRLPKVRRKGQKSREFRPFVDCCAATYATAKAVLLVRSLERDDDGAPLEQGLLTTLWATLARSARNATNRISTAKAPEDDRTPYAVEAELDPIVFVRGRFEKSTADPPRKD